MIHFEKNIRLFRFNIGLHFKTAFALCNATHFVSETCLLFDADS